MYGSPLVTTGLSGVVASTTGLEKLALATEPGAGTEIELTVPASRAYAKSQVQLRFGLFRKKTDVV